MLALFLFPLLVMLLKVLNPMTWGPEWAAAYGSWFGGLGSFAAGGIALWVSTQEQRSRATEKKKENDIRRIIILNEVITYAFKTETAFNYILERTNTVAFANAVAVSNHSAIRAFLTKDIRFDPIDRLQKLPLVPEISVAVLQFETRLEDYLDKVGNIRAGTDTNPAVWIQHAKAMARIIQVSLSQISSQASKMLEGIPPM